MKIFNVSEFYGEHKFVSQCPKLTPWQDDKFLFLNMNYNSDDNNLNFFQLFEIGNDFNSIVFNKIKKFDDEYYDYNLQCDGKNPKEIFLVKIDYENNKYAKYSIPNLKRIKQKIDLEPTFVKQSYQKGNILISAGYNHGLLSNFIFRNSEIRKNDLMILRSDGTGFCATTIMTVCDDESDINQCCISNDGLKAAFLMIHYGKSISKIVVIDLE